MAVTSDLTPRPRDALVMVDVQRDFLPGGALAVPDGDKIIPSLNHMIERFTAQDSPVFATRDWHPKNHGSFADFGGRWPPHCIANTPGAEFPESLELSKNVVVVSKGTRPEDDAYSAFDGTDFERQLTERGVRRLYVGGLATDYCVAATVHDALARGFAVVLLVDAMRAIGDGPSAIAEMVGCGAVPLRDEMLA